MADIWHHNAPHMTSFVKKKSLTPIITNICNETKHPKKMLLALDGPCNIWPYRVTSHQSHYCLYYNNWHTGVFEETFDVNSTTQYSKCHCRKASLQEMANFGNYPGELTALVPVDILFIVHFPLNKSSSFPKKLFHNIKNCFT